ncbi:hypothetical protein EJ04DRAFT_524450 [Polyplosphaeria fusca]|uniref:Uncharacterized protein n=1 Tax=Polyplosphaeria fusca TaxID=682080 RepID=A0A9P4QZ24_9PLEO|nr:hypothetical protein EJ04DRAFT_524450 [Polyplosphaeria fusca]
MDSLTSSFDALDFYTAPFEPNEDPVPFALTQRPIEDSHTIQDRIREAKEIFPVLRFPNEMIGCIIEQIIGPAAHCRLVRSILPAPFNASQSCTLCIGGRELRDAHDWPVIPYLLKSEDDFVKEEIQRQLWQDSTKLFKDPFTLVAWHLAIRADWSEQLTKHWNNAFQRIKLIPLARNDTTEPGVLDRLKLDFSIEDFMKFFDVNVPPFDRPGRLFNLFWNWREREQHGVFFLKHTKELTLVFGRDFLWNNPWPKTIDAKVCRLGWLPDLVLSFAWANIKHVPVIRIQGNVQPWVRDKWEAKIEGDRNFEPDLAALMNIGKEEAFYLNQPYRWEDYYPAKCQCEQSCYDLAHSKIDYPPWKPDFRCNTPGQMM